MSGSGAASRAARSRGTVGASSSASRGVGVRPSKFASAAAGSANPSRPKPRTSVTVMPTTPSSVSASFTSSSLNGLMMASIFFISDLLKDRDRERRDVRADALQVRQDIQVDLRRLDGLGEAGAQPSEVGLAQIPLAVPDHRALVEDFLRQPAVVGGEGGDGPLEVLSDQSVELLDLRPARVGEPPSLVELLPGELHQRSEERRVGKEGRSRWS